MSDLKARLLDIRESVSVYTDASMCLRVLSPVKVKQLGQEAHDRIEELEAEIERLQSRVDTLVRRLEVMNAQTECMVREGKDE